MTMHDLWNWIWAKELAFAGAAGGTVVALTEWRGWLPFARHLIVGMLFATYAYELGIALLSPAFAVLDFAPERKAAAGAFLTGAIAILLVQFILEFTRSAWSRISKGGREG